MNKLRNLDPLLESKVVDRLYEEAKLVKKLVNFLTTEICAPFTISIDGDWGTGKTTIMKLIQQSLEESQLKYPTFWFNPWEYKGSQNIVLSFLKNLANKYSGTIQTKESGFGNFFKLLTLSGIDLVSRVVSNGHLSVEMIKNNAELVESGLPQWVQHVDIVTEIKN